MAVGGVGMAAASALVGAEPAAAADGDPVLLAVTNSALATTEVDSSGTGPAMIVSSTGGDGLWGVTSAATSYGVFGQGVGTGVNGTSDAGPAIIGVSSGDGDFGVYGYDVSADGGYGVLGEAADVAGVGLYGINDNGGPSLQLLGTSSALPVSAAPGQFVVLTDGSLNYCRATNEWAPLSSVVAITPVRVIDTTTGTGGISGPLVPGSTVHISNPIAGTNGIPSGATAIVGNFAISGVGGALLNGFGVATIFPAGVTPPATANINAGAGCFAISNAVTVGLGTGGDVGRVSIVWGGGGPVPNAHAFLDVTGYIL
jgi:hypothetical protein